MADNPTEFRCRLSCLLCRIFEVSQLKRVVSSRQRLNAARAGETPTEIAAALGISLTTYGRWAALYGFRVSDLDPNDKRGRAQHEAGTASGMSGRFMLRKGLGGRVKGSGRPPGIDLEAEHLFTTKSILNAVRGALEADDRSRVDRLIAAWKVKARRTRDLAALEAEAAEELSAGLGAPISDDDLVAEISALLGRPLKLRD